MEITVKMTVEEFQQFVAWQKAIDADPKKPGKVKIIDQEHAAELLEMAKDYLT